MKRGKKKKPAMLLYFKSYKPIKRTFAICPTIYPKLGSKDGEIDSCFFQRN